MSVIKSTAATTLFDDTEIKIAAKGFFEQQQLVGKLLSYVIITQTSQPHETTFIKQTNLCKFFFLQIYRFQTRNISPEADYGFFVFWPLLLYSWEDEWSILTCVCVASTQTVQANTGPNEPHAANLASVPEEGLRQELEDQALSLESTLRREVDVDDFLMSKLPSHPKLHRGCLENGLHYVILPNKVPPNR